MEKEETRTKENEEEKQGQGQTKKRKWKEVLKNRPRIRRIISNNKYINNSGGNYHKSHVYTMPSDKIHINIFLKSYSIRISSDDTINQDQLACQRLRILAISIYYT